jgi:hypothetical protein
MASTNVSGFSSRAFLDPYIIRNVSLSFHFCSLSILSGRVKAHHSVNSFIRALKDALALIQGLSNFVLILHRLEDCLLKRRSCISV